MIIPRTRQRTRIILATSLLQGNITRTLTTLRIRHTKISILTLGMNNDITYRYLKLRKGGIRRVVRVRRVTNERRTKRINLRILIRRDTINIKIGNSTNVLRRLILQSRTRKRSRHVALMLLLNTKSKPAIHIRLKSNRTNRAIAAVSLNSNITRVRQSVMIVRALRSITQRTKKMKRRLRRYLRVDTFRHRTTYRSRTSVTKTRSSSLLTKRPIMRIRMDLHNTYNRRTHQALTKGTRYTTTTLLTTRNGRRDLYLVLTRATTNKNNSSAVLHRTRRHNTNLMESLALIRFVGRHLYVFQTKRTLTRTTRARAIVSTLTRSTTRRHLTLRGSRITSTLLIRLRHYNGAYETTTSGRGIFLFRHSIFLLPRVTNRCP